MQAFNHFQPAISGMICMWFSAMPVLPAPRNTWYTTWLTLSKLSPTVTIGGIAYDYMITNIVGKPGTPTNQIYWQLSSLNKGDSLMVNASNVVLYLPGGISMKSAIICCLTPTAMYRFIAAPILTPKTVL